MPDDKKDHQVLEEQEPDGKGENFWRLVSKYRGPKGAMLRLAKGTAINSRDVSEGLDVKVNSASNYLREANKEDLLKCVTPDSHRNKMYKLTEDGKQILEEMK